MPSERVTCLPAAGDGWAAVLLTTCSPKSSFAPVVAAVELSWLHILVSCHDGFMARTSRCPVAASALLHPPVVGCLAVSGAPHDGPAGAVRGGRGRRGGG